GGWCNTLKYKQKIMARSLLPNARTNVFLRTPAWRQGHEFFWVDDHRDHGHPGAVECAGLYLRQYRKQPDNRLQADRCELLRHRDRLDGEFPSARRRGRQAELYQFGT